MTLKTHTRQLVLAALLLSISLAGCSATPTTSDTTTDQGNSQDRGQSQTVEREVPFTPLTGQTFYQLFLAEIATNRRDFGTAAELYSRLDRVSDDPQVAQRAAALNQAIGNYERMQEHAEHWTELSPSTPEAWQALSIAALANRDFSRAEPAMRHWLDRDSDPDIENAMVGTGDYTQSEQAIVLSLLDVLQADYPTVSSLSYVRAQIWAEQAEWSDALVAVQRARSIEDAPRSGLLEYRIHLQLDEIDDARDTIVALAERFPESSQVATAYAGFTFADDGQDKADVLESLFNRFPNEPVIARAFARESFDNDDFETAEALFLRLTETEFADEARYFLGRINIANGRPDMASEYLLAVQQPPFLISALAELSELWRDNRFTELQQVLDLARQDFPNNGPVFWRIEADAFRQTGQPEQGFLALQQGLATYPNDTSLLYDQALLAASLDRFDVLEDNLKQILANEPDNANALNALGYTWADRGENLELAADYIDRALEMRPDDPAIMDSKGWVEYRLGNLEEAEYWLRRALEAFDNDEVAAHLAEVLWVTERKDEARHWLRHALDLDPQSPTATDVIDRFEVEL